MRLKKVQLPMCELPQNALPARSNLRLRSQLTGAEKKNEESEERRHSDTHLVTREGRHFVKLNASVEEKGMTEFQRGVGG